MPELKRVIAAFGNRIAMEDTLDASLRRLFGGGSVVGKPGLVMGNTEAVPHLAAEALEHFRKAQEHLGRWNWTGFGEELRRVEESLQRLQGRRDH